MVTEQQQFTIASPDDFDHSEIVQLPSQAGTDKAVRLQQPDLVQLFSEGDAPDLLSNIALGHLNGGGVEAGVQITKDNLPDLLQTLNLICRASFVEPKIGNDKGQLPLERIPFNDRMFVFQWALGAEYQPTKNFPEQTGENLEAVQSSNGVSSEAEQLTHNPK